ncbi:hypothetical protein POX_d06152 [Penicillium oxalicum]|uniref:uncharacterized protein n=1 Tax=Penicillium oxalicum TaxID=69781 RepID=UPI0020B7D57E|nr:uncharacterized protein POX_u09927 [Penicillium oxalicum]XP_049969928.1 hypothetical protein POX_d06152 [Penicillium oxalicum]KAI2785612.1 hypothetical protein POX_u09927 [Penicillium oxalicum]KAI2790631.1 hypothetical protein POX_d06152 [Penicillium oxalicum]
MLMNPFRPFEGPPTFQEEYRGNYIPKVIKKAYGLQVIAPDTPFVAAAGPNKLYFIDTRFDEKTARHIKEQIERAAIPNPEEYIAIDEISATAELKNSVTGETTFVFDPLYAKVLFAKGLNRHNPELKLPEYEPTRGDWMVIYDLENLFAKGDDTSTGIA